MRISLMLTIALASFANFCFSENLEDKTMNTSSHSEKNPVVLIKTNMGDIKLELFENKAPITVKNFLQYAQDGHYNNTIFHRVIDGFMVQGGGFTSELKQKPTRTAITNEAENGLKNKRGTVAMARTNDVNSATSQFFINVADNSFLDNRGKTPREFGYCVFGKVLEGMDVVDKIKDAKTWTRDHHENVPVETIEILDVKKV